MKLHTTFSSVLKGLIVVSIMLFLSAAGFQDKLTSGWYQQYFPNLNGSTVKDMTFLDSLTGFAVTTVNSSYQGYILKTTNGGDNWNVKFTYNPPYTNVSFNKIQFANNNTGYANIDYVDLIKTTNGGDNWFPIFTGLYSEDMVTINADTLLFVKSNSFNGGVFRSTNGGYNWQTIWSMGGSGNPQKIYMVNKDLGFTQDEGLSNYMKRTTDGGFNWTGITGEKFKDISFFDSNTGWKVNNEIRKTTNGGINWFLQQTPNIINGFYIPSKLSVLNKDTVWMVGAYSNGGIVLKTTNGGLNWGYQYPNPTLPVTTFKYINFVDSKHGWAYSIYGTNNLLFHTKVGGNDTTFFTGIKLVPNIVPEKYSLGQNYPNPFNPSTKIKFDVPSLSFPNVSVGNSVTLKVYDVMGREVQTLVNESLKPGTYEVTFNIESATEHRRTFGTGVYFYKLTTDGFSETKKMLMIK